ncbi:MAG: hypothetical protein ACI9WU_003387, partial [Myxococcota bacterium]
PAVTRDVCQQRARAQERQHTLEPSNEPHDAA